MKALLLDAKDAADKARAAGQTQAADFAVRERRYDLIVAEAYKNHPPPVFAHETAANRRKQRPKNPFWLLLLDRFGDYKRYIYILTFVRKVEVPFDNNGSERDIRMTKVRQKIAGRFRGIDAPAWFCRIRGYLTTLRKQNMEALPTLKALFDGNTVMPKLT